MYFKGDMPYDLDTNVFITNVNALLTKYKNRKWLRYMYLTTEWWKKEPQSPPQPSTIPDMDVNNHVDTSNPKQKGGDGVTPEVTTDVTPEVTKDVIPEVTKDVIPEVTKDVIPEVTQEVTSDITPDFGRVK